MHFIHPTSQMLPESKLFRKLWKNSRVCAVSINGSKSDLRYAVGHVCWEDNESCHLETFQVANRKGKPSNILSFFIRVKLRV